MDPINIIRRTHRDILKCRFCKTVPNDISYVSSTVDATLSPGLVLHCACDTTNLPFVVCIHCRSVSSQKRRADCRVRYQGWYKKHFTSADHLEKLSKLSPESFPDNSGGDFLSADDDGVFEAHESNGGTRLSRVTPVVINGVSLVDCEYLNDRMRRFYDREHHQPGLGFAHIIRTAFGVVCDVSHFSQQEVSFHLNTCRLCVDATRSQLKRFGTLLNEVIFYYAGMHSTQHGTSVSDVDADSLITDFTNIASSRNVIALSQDQELLLRECLTIQYVKSQKFCLDDFSAKVVEHQAPQPRGIFQATYPPKNPADLSRLYLSSDKSIYKNIPCPDVHLTPNKCHAYVTLGQIVASFLASGIDPLQVPTQAEFHTAATSDFCSYYTSPVAQAVYSKVSQIALLKGLGGKVFSIHVKDWGDDAQKNSSRTNLLSYNIRTVTFLRHGGNGDVRYYTYVLSVGKKSSDHEIVEKMLTQELHELGETPHLFYSGMHRGTFWATVSLVAGVRDRPARGETFFVGIHSHIFGKRHRYSLYHDPNSKIMSCQSCHIRRVCLLQLPVLPEESPHICLFCADLDYMAVNILDTKLSYIESKTKAKDFSYPKSLVEGSPAAPVERPIGPSVKVISPVKLDYPFLTKICFVSFYNYHARAHESRRRQLLSKRERRGLGPIQGWNNKELYSYLRTASLNKAMFLRMKKFSIINIHLSPAELQERLVEEVMPAAWGRSGYELSHQHDAVFHLVFHGILPDVWEILLKSLAAFEIRSKFEDVVNPSLLAIHNLQIEDVIVIPFGGGFSMAGWIGSNKLGFSWLIPYYVSQLRFLLREKLEGVDVEARTKVELILGRIERTVRAFSCVISRLLQRSLYPQLPIEVEHYVKIFLYEITSLQETYIPSSKRTKFAYLSTGNFLSMLNLEENLRMFGPIRNFWDALDEKAVQRVKQAFANVNMTSERWLAALLENVTRDQHLRMLWDRKVGGDTSSGRFSKLRIMKERDVDLLLESKHAFSALFIDSMFYVVYRVGGDRSDKLFMKRVHVEPVHSMVGLVSYYPYEISDDEPIDYSSLPNGDEHCYCMFLPYLQAQTSDDDMVQETDDETELADTSCASIIDYQHHKVFNGDCFVLPVVWEVEDGIYAVSTNNTLDSGHL